MVIENCWAYFGSACAKNSLSPNRLEKSWPFWKPALNALTVYAICCSVLQISCLCSSFLNTFRISLCLLHCVNTNSVHSILTWLFNLVRQLRQGCHFDIQTVKKRLRQLTKLFFHRNQGHFHGTIYILTELAKLRRNQKHSH